MDFYMAKNIRKAVLLLAMLSVIVGMFTACGNKKSDDGRTTFTVGFDAEFPPYGYKDDSGEYVGFDLDLAQEVCERNGWNLVKQPIDWDSKDMELSSGSIDCIWNGFTLNGREREYTWSKAYIDNSQVVIVKSGSGIKKLEDLKGNRLIHQLLQHLQERMQQKKILHLRHNLRHFSRYLIITQHL
jgi:ABC-type amino acid transport substrate-binding protein